MKVCIIPARGGSKRIPKKNIKPFCTKPMIAYSIEAAQKSQCFDKILVSTDDSEIANIAKSLGAEVPFIRPDELSNDYTATLPIIKHAIDWIEDNVGSVSYVCCLYATAPFVKFDYIKSAYKQLLETKSNYCFTVTKYVFPIQRAVKITNNQRLQMFNPDFFATRSQDLEEAYHDAGQFYWGKADSFKKLDPLFSEQSSPFILPHYLVQDIDTIDDWKRAEIMYQVLKKMGDLL